MENRIEQIIARQFSGEATPEDQHLLRQWLRANQANQAEYNKISLAYQLTSGKSDSVRKQRVYHGLINRIQPDNKTDKVKEKRRRIRNWWSVAAAVVFVLSFSWVLYNYSKPLITVQSPGEELIVKTNPAGQKLKIYLPDGSIVWLNSSSELSYQKEFNNSIRSINLSGEAYFEVIRDSSRPFIVRTGSLTTTATGTSFNIDAFNHNKIVVSLTSGSVNVESEDPTRNPVAVQLKPGEGAVYDVARGGKIQKISINIDEVRAWKDGILRFSNASLEETILNLERWYGVEIRVANGNSKQWKVNGVFDNEYLENVLNSLGFSQGFEYSIQGKNVIIKIR